jgi:hypothetical protein
VLITAFLAGCGYLGTDLVAAAGAFAVVALSLGWGVLLHLKHPRGSTLAIALSGWAALIVSHFVVGSAHPLGAFAGVFAGAVLLAFAHELMRRDGRRRLVESLTGTVAGQIAAILSAGWVLLLGTPWKASGGIVVGASVIAAVLMDVAPLAAPLRAGIAVAAGTLASVGAGLMVGPAALLPCATTGLLVAIAVSGVRYVLAGVQVKGPRLGVLAVASAPVAVAGSVAYAVAYLLLK